MTIEQRERIKGHLDELCEWLDEQTTGEAAEEIAMERDYWRNEFAKADSDIEEARAQRNDALVKLDEMEAKVALLVDYLRTMQRYHRSAGAYFMEQGKTEEEDKHGEVFVECVCAEVMCMKMFDENDVEYVNRRIRMYDDLAKSYESRLKV